MFSLILVTFWPAMKLIFATEVTEDTEVFLISSSPGDNSLSWLTVPFLPTNLLIALEKTHQANGPYGIRKNFDKVLLSLDEPQRFKKFLLSLHN